MISSIPPTSGRFAMPPPPLKPEEVFKKIDRTNKGYITESELASAIVLFSPEGMRLSQEGAKSVAKDSFTKMDADGDGKVTISEFKATAPHKAANAGPPQGVPPGSPPGARGPNKASASQSTDPADTNQDGIVSEAERLAYASKQQVSASNTTTITTTTTEIL